MEVYTGPAGGTEQKVEEDDILLDLDMELAELSPKHLAIAVFYSHKSYNPQVLFADMLKAWRISQLAGVEKVDDYIFRIEFGKLEEKN
jgi:hypothetical protein